MAVLIPAIDELKLLPQPLTRGEEALMYALIAALDDSWTIYVQPHINGLKPDMVAYKENCGLGIFEVKDWNLEYYRTEESGNGYAWEQFNSAENRWDSCEYECPFKQVKRYRDTIFKYEIPILSAHCSIDKRVYQYVNMFVFFHGYPTDLVEDKLAPVFQHQKYVNGFGDDCLDPERLRRYLQNHHLTRYFPEELMDGLRAEEIDQKIRNALAYHRSPIDVKSLLVKFTARQKELLVNDAKPRRLVASAGSGKTLILVHKAVNAAREGKKTLLVCFNITMSNYLRDMIVGLANHYQLNAHQNIYVRHYHRIYPLDGPENYEDLPDQVGVLLIDEGQDFEREWIIQLTEKFKPHHWMIVEDLRQNIYEKDYRKRRSIQGITGRPNQLKESYRLPGEISQLANALIRWKKIQEDPEESSEVESVNTQLSFLMPAWGNGNMEQILAAIRLSLRNMIAEGQEETLENVAILVCEIEEDGWPVLDMLEQLKLPYQANFESRHIHHALEYNHEKHHPIGCNFRMDVEDLRRGLKANFYARSGRITVCTIHSFKGWELDHVMVIFRPRRKNGRHEVSLLYTAITRSMNQLTLYNADDEFDAIGEFATQQGLARPFLVTPEIPN